MRRLLALALLLVAPRLFAADAPTFPKPDLPPGDAVRELRLGVVCYGGVSLAIYMYGTTRELHHLVLASTALECDAAGGAACGEVARGSAWDTLPLDAKPYYIALVRKWETDKARTRVVIDVISGTSAGGINGIFLAKALTHNAPIDALRAIWFREADINRLASFRPWYVSALFRVLSGKSALDGNAWLKQLYAALNAMDDVSSKGRLPSLMAATGQPLDLLVTSTDFYGTERTLAIGDPPTSSELRYDHVFRFAAERSASDGAVRALDFEKENNAALAFAARSSASFPVAFPPIRLADLTTLLGVPAETTISLAGRHFGDRLADLRDEKDAAGRLAANLFLVDGGVLDNYPFGIAYQRVSGRTPAIETERRFIYLEPDPRMPRAAEATFDSPRVLRMFLQSKLAIQGAEPIAQDLLEFDEHNRRVDRIREIIRRDEEIARAELPGTAVGEVSIAKRTEDAMGVGRLGRPAGLQGEMIKSMGPAAQKARPVDSPKCDRECEAVTEMRLRVERDAQGNVPIMDEAYLRLRVQSVLDQFGRVLSRQLCTLPEHYQGDQISRMRDLVNLWAQRRRLAGDDVDRQARDSFLRAFDLGYVRRKLRFVNDWLNAQYDPQRYKEFDHDLDRDKLEEAQRAVSTHIATLTAWMSGERLRELNVVGEVVAAQAACAVIRRPAPDQEAIDRALDALDALETAVEPRLLDIQDDVLAELYDDFVRHTATWQNEKAARAVIARYLGFPYWDRVAYPYTAASGTGDLTRVSIMRFSPDDTLTLSTKRAEKLAGVKKGHFGAFFTPDGREQDYLWGRLDGAERVLTMLGYPGDEVRFRSAFDAILAKETSDAAVKPANLQTIRNCVTNKGSC